MLEEFDNKIFDWFIHHTPSNIGLLNGLCGIGFYFLKRIQNTQSSDEKLQTLINKQGLIQLVDVLESWLTYEVIEELLDWVSNSSKNSNKSIEGQENCQLQIGGFDITSDYSVLLWLLTELQEKDIFNSKVERLITDLLKPLSIKKVVTMVEANKLLLLLGLTKLKSTNVQCTKKVEFESVYTYLINGINYDSLEEEFVNLPLKVKNGLAGVYSLCKQLCEMTNEDVFNRILCLLSSFIDQEARIEQLLCQDESSILAKEEYVFGLLEGFAGIYILT